MKFSEQWLREWVNPDLTTDELAEQLTMSGLEVDTVEAAAGEFTGVVVGEVVSLEPHPDADKLRVCQVNAGGEPLQIVCGAPNVHVGMKAPTALVGARLPGGFKIKQAKLRGVASSGMLCSARELGLSEDHAGLMALAADAPVGAELRDYLQLEDRIIDIDLTPNRGDCLGIAGIAREVGALTATTVVAPEISSVSAATEERFPIEVQAPEACPRYLGRVIRGVNPGATTPLWMQERLRRGGIRSLGPVVDVTNYVLLELGQPMHAFDLARLQGGIRVRYAEPGERLTLLDERELELDSDALVIADHERPLALAGIMGGAGSGVGEATEALLLECAFFAPEKIAGRARRYGLHTDSSFRFERGVDPGLQHRAMERASRLLLDIVGGEAGPIIEVASEAELPRRAPIPLRRDRIQRLLGLAPEESTVEDVLSRLGMELVATAEGWRVTPPSFRFDIAMEADLIEEVGRIYGYDRLPSTGISGAGTMFGASESRLPLERLRGLLVDRGYQEVITYSFVDPEIQQLTDPERAPIPLANPLSAELSVMRTSLWQGLLRAAQYNLNRQQKRIRIFEHGLNFIKQDHEIKQEMHMSGLVSGGLTEEQWDQEPRMADFFDVKGDVEALLAVGGMPEAYQFRAGSHPALHPGQAAEILCGERRAGWLGAVHPRLAKVLDLDPKTFLFELHSDTVEAAAPARYEDISKFPSVRRDFAVVVSDGISAAEIQVAVRDACGEQLKELLVFDVYRGKGIETGRKSIAFGLILQDSSRTLTDEDVESVAGQVVKTLQDRFGANLRE